MDSLNRTVTIIVGVVLAIGVFVAGKMPPEPSNDPWFQQVVLKNSKPVVVKFGADWCGPCRGMDAALNNLQPAFSNQAMFLKIDVDKKPELFAHYRSGGGIPQIMVFKDGNLVASQRGFGGEDRLKQWIEANL